MKLMNIKVKVPEEYHNEFVFTQKKCLDLTVNGIFVK
jgi:hypothetical protein